MDGVAASPTAPNSRLRTDSNGLAKDPTAPQLIGFGAAPPRTYTSFNIKQMNKGGGHRTIGKRPTIGS